MSAGDSGVRATAVDPDGRTVVLQEQRWRHVVNGHPELRSLEHEVMVTVERPTVRRPGRSLGETWHYLQLQQPRPAPWLKVVVRYEAQGRSGRDRVPAEVHAVTMTVGSTTFDHVDYDSDADVLYLHAGDPAAAVDFDESPEGHGLRFDAQGHLVGITIVGARKLLERGDRLVITVPERLEVDSTELAAIIDAA